MEALLAGGTSPHDEASFKAYFSKLLDLYLDTPEGRSRTTAPEMEARPRPAAAEGSAVDYASARPPQELLDFAEAHPELSHAAMLAVSNGAAGASEEEELPGASLARAAAAQPPLPRAAAAEPQWVEIQPSPEFVVKTRSLEGGWKALVNVCSSPHVAAPGDWEHGKARPEALLRRPSRR